MIGYLNMGLAASIKHWRWMVSGLVAASALASLAIYMSYATGTPIRSFLRDCTAIGQMPAYYGSLEAAGAVGMAIGGGIAIFSGLVSKSARVLLVGGGILTMALSLDDLFQLHENAWRIGMTEKRVYATYLVALIGIGALSWRSALRTPLAVLGLSLGLLTVAAAIDQSEKLAAAAPTGSEGMLELFAFVLWSAYFICTGKLALGGAMSAETLSSGQSKSGAEIPAQGALT